MDHELCTPGGPRGAPTDNHADEGTSRLARGLAEGRIAELILDGSVNLTHVTDYCFIKLVGAPSPAERQAAARGMLQLCQHEQLRLAIDERRMVEGLHQIIKRTLVPDVLGLSLRVFLAVAFPQDTLPEDAAYSREVRQVVDRCRQLMERGAAGTAPDPSTSPPHAVQHLAHLSPDAPSATGSPSRSSPPLSTALAPLGSPAALELAEVACGCLRHPAVLRLLSPGELTDTAREAAVLLIRRRSRRTLEALKALVAFAAATPTAMQLQQQGASGGSSSSSELPLAALGAAVVGAGGVAPLVALVGQGAAAQAGDVDPLDHPDATDARAAAQRAAAAPGRGLAPDRAAALDCLHAVVAGVAQGLDAGPAPQQDDPSLQRDNSLGIALPAVDGRNPVLPLPPSSDDIEVHARNSHEGRPSSPRLAVESAAAASGIPAAGSIAPCGSPRVPDSPPGAPDTARLASQTSAGRTKFTALVAALFNNGGSAGGQAPAGTGDAAASASADAGGPGCAVFHAAVQQALQAGALEVLVPLLARGLARGEEARVLQLLAWMAVGRGQRGQVTSALQAAVAASPDVWSGFLRAASELLQPQQLPAAAEPAAVTSALPVLPPLVPYGMVLLMEVAATEAHRSADAADDLLQPASAALCRRAVAALGGGGRLARTARTSAAAAAEAAASPLSDAALSLLSELVPYLQPASAVAGADKPLPWLSDLVRALAARAIAAAQPAPAPSSVPGGGGGGIRVLAALLCLAKVLQALGAESQQALLSTGPDLDELSATVAGALEQQAPPQPSSAPFPSPAAKGLLPGAAGDDQRALLQELAAHVVAAAWLRRAEEQLRGVQPAGSPAADHEAAARSSVGSGSTSGTAPKPPPHQPGLLALARAVALSGGVAVLVQRVREAAMAAAGKAVAATTAALGVPYEASYDGRIAIRALLATLATLAASAEAPAATAANGRSAPDSSGLVAGLDGTALLPLLHLQPHGGAADALQLLVLLATADAAAAPGRLAAFRGALLDSCAASPRTLGAFLRSANAALAAGWPALSAAGCTLLLDVCGALCDRAHGATEVLLSGGGAGGVGSNGAGQSADSSTPSVLYAALGVLGALPAAAVSSAARAAEALAGAPGPSARRYLRTSSIIGASSDVGAAAALASVQQLATPAAGYPPALVESAAGLVARLIPHLPLAAAAAGAGAGASPGPLLLLHDVVPALAARAVAPRCSRSTRVAVLLSLSRCLDRPDLPPQEWPSYDSMLDLADVVAAALGERDLAASEPPSPALPDPPSALSTRELMHLAAQLLHRLAAPPPPPAAPAAGSAADDSRQLLVARHRVLRLASATLDSAVQYGTRTGSGSATGSGVLAGMGSGHGSELNGGESSAGSVASRLDCLSEALGAATCALEPHFAPSDSQPRLLSHLPPSPLQLLRLGGLLLAASGEVLALLAAAEDSGIDAWGSAVHGGTWRGALAAAGRATRLLAAHQQGTLSQRLAAAEVELARMADKAAVHPGGPWSALHQAACEGKGDAVLLMLLDAGTAVEARDKDGRTPLHVACTSGVKEVVRALLAAGADKAAADREAATPLHAACRTGHEEAVRLLLEAGADREARKQDGSTPLHCAAGATCGHGVAVRVLLEAGAARDALDGAGRSPLHCAAAAGGWEAAKRLLAAGADRDARDKAEDSPLDLAVAGGHAAAARVLLEAGADPAATKQNGDQLLHVACRSGHAEVVRALLEAGADREALNWDADTPLHVACKAGRAEVVRALLAAGADKEATNGDGDGPMHLACRVGAVEVVRVLMEAGADCEAKNGGDDRPLHFAAAAGHGAVVRLLLEAGADREAANWDGDRPLHMAAEAGFADVVEALLEAGADPDAPGQDGKTAMDYATQVSFHASLSRVGQYRAVATLLQAAQERGEAAAAAPEDAAAAAEEQQRGRAAAGGGAVEAVAVVVAPAGAEAGSEKALAPTLSGAGAALLRRSGVFEDVDCGGSLGPLERSGLSVRSVTAAGGGGTPGVAARTKAVAEWLAAGHGEGGAEGAEAPAA